MSAVRSCPKCSGRVAPPWGAAGDHWVRCPICGAEYRLGDVLEFDPPELVLIDEPAAPAEGRIPQWAAVAAAAADLQGAPAVSEVAMPDGDLPEIELLVPPPLAIGEPVTSDRVGEDTEVITFDDSLLLDESAPGMDTDADHFASAHEQVAVFDEAAVSDKGKSMDFGLPPRRRSRHGNPFMMLVGYVGGGVLGLAIGYAILMWGFSKDPFELGPKLPDLLVPSALRSASNPHVVRYADDAQSNPESSASDPSRSSEQADPNDSDPLFPPIDPAPTNEAASDSLPGATNPFDAAKDDAAKVDSAANDRSMADDDGESRTDAVPADLAKTDTATDAAASDIAPAEPSPTAASTAPTMLPTTGDQEAGPTARRHYLVDDLHSAIRAAQSTTKAAVTLPVDAPHSRKLAVNAAYYTNLSKIAEALTHLDAHADSAAREQALDAAIAAFLDAAPTAQQLAELGKLGGYWYDNPRGNGIVLVGAVKDSKPAGKLVESVVEPLGGASGDKRRAITVVSPAPLTDDPNRMVLVVGTIVNRPAEDLRGYEGAAKRAVWGAMAIDPLSSRGTE